MRRSMYVGETYKVNLPKKELKRLEKIKEIEVSDLKGTLKIKYRRMEYED
jgi:hypothetical protein